MNGGSDVKSGIDVTTTRAFAVTGGPFLLLFATHVVPLCYHLKTPAVATDWDLVRATRHYTRRRFGTGKEASNIYNFEPNAFLKSV